MNEKYPISVNEKNVIKRLNYQYLRLKKENILN